MTQLGRLINPRNAPAGPLKTITRRLVDAVLPPLCMRCQQIVDAPGLLCPTCWQNLIFISASHCNSCGLPFEMVVEPGTVCGGCLRKKQVYNHARAAVAYDENSKSLALSLKYGDRTDIADGLARLMVQAGGEVLETADIIAPVPLHWSRLFARRYNQSALLAQSIARQTGIPLCQDLLVRHRKTPSQGKLRARERYRNVRAAFSMRMAKTSLIKDKTVLLIDDVLTTGSTVNGCARILLRHGAKRVNVLTLARVVRAERLEK